MNNNYLSNFDKLENQFSKTVYSVKDQNFNVSNNNNNKISNRPKSDYHNDSKKRYS